MSKISLGQIDLIALQQYLEIVAGFRKADDEALNVTYVGKYTRPTEDDTDDPTKVETIDVKANEVAMAAMEGGLPVVVTDNNGVIVVPERNTVMNSQMLGGIPASEYLPRVDAGTILTDVNQATYNLSDDIRNLKDELYQLKNQLAKVGTIKDTNVYNGYIDPFIESKETHTVSTDVIVTEVIGDTVHVQSIGNLNKGDIVVLENNGEFNIQKILLVGYNQFDVDTGWEGASGPVEAHQGSVIRKSLGISKNGKFVFGCKSKTGKVATDEMKYIAKDGVDRVKVFELDHNGHGYGTEIKIPASLSSCVISKIEISLAVKGNPGELKGVFWKYNELLQTFERTEYATATIPSNEASGWFNNVTRELITEMPVQPGERYILILETISASDTDKWFIGGFTDEDCADDIHNDSYIQSNDLLYKSIEDKDMFLSLTTKKLEETDTVRLPYGLYTCDFDVHDTKANRIRVELCVNQEGLFKVSDDLKVNYATGIQSEIPLDTKASTVIRDQVFAKEDIVVIGQEIGEVYSVGNNNNNIHPLNDMYVKPSADVYRVGYEVQAIASVKEFDYVATGVMTKYTEVQNYSLKLVEVIPGRDVIRPYQSSDRLIFEAEFYDQSPEGINNNKLESFDHIQVQVRWYSNIDKNTLQTMDDLEGAIYDIAVSVDQAYIKNPN